MAPDTNVYTFTVDRIVAQNDKFKVRPSGGHEQVLTAAEFFMSGHKEAEVVEFKRYEVQGTFEGGGKSGKFEVLVNPKANLVRIVAKSGHGPAMVAKALNRLLPHYIGRDKMVMKRVPKGFGDADEPDGAVVLVRVIPGENWMECRTKDGELLANVFREMKHGPPQRFTFLMGLMEGIIYHAARKLGAATAKNGKPARAVSEEIKKVEKPN